MFNGNSISWAITTALPAIWNGSKSDSRWSSAKGVLLSVIWLRTWCNLSIKSHNRTTLWLTRSQTPTLVWIHLPWCVRACVFSFQAGWCEGSSQWRGAWAALVCTTSCFNPRRVHACSRNSIQAKPWSTKQVDDRGVVFVFAWFNDDALGYNPQISIHLLSWFAWARWSISKFHDKTHSSITNRLNYSTLFIIIELKHSNIVRW